MRSKAPENFLPILSTRFVRAGYHKLCEKSLGDENKDTRQMGIAHMCPVNLLLNLVQLLLALLDGLRESRDLCLTLTELVYNPSVRLMIHLQLHSQSLELGVKLVSVSSILLTRLTGKPELSALAADKLPP